MERKWIPKAMDMMAFFKCRLKQQNKKNLPRIIILLAVGLGINLLMYFTSGTIPIAGILFLAFVVLVMGYYLVVHPRITMKQAQKAYQWDAYFQEEKTLIVEGQGFVLQAKHQSTQVQLSSLVGVQSCEKYFFLYTAPSKALVIPKAIIEKGEDGQELLSWFENFANQVNERSTTEDPRFV
jgi:hypothetical protein